MHQESCGHPAQLLAGLVEDIVDWLLANAEVAAAVRADADEVDTYVAKSRTSKYKSKKCRKLRPYSPKKVLCTRGILRVHLKV